MARVLRGGAGVFWATARDVVYLPSAAKVAIALGVASFRAAFRTSLGNLRGSLSRVRARLAIQGFAALRRGRRISNAEMANIAGVDARTITRWRKSSRVRSFQNFARVAPLQPGTIAGDFRRSQPALRTVRFEGRRWMARRIADSLNIPKLGGVRSHLRRANRRLRAFSDKSGGDTARRHPYGDARRRTPADPSHILLYTLEGYGRRAGQLVRVCSVIPEVRARHFVHRMRP